MNKSSVAIYKKVRNHMAKKLSNVGNPFIEYMKGFYEFLCTYKNGVLFVLFLTILNFSYFVLNFTLSIDEEIGNIYKMGILSLGRYGIVLCNAIFFRDLYIVPYLTDFIAVICLTSSSLLCCYNYVLSSEKPIQECSIPIFCGFYISFPYVIAQQLAFSYQAVAIMFSFVIVSFIAGILINQPLLKNKLLLLFSSICLMLAFSSYQSVVILYITIVTSIVLFMRINGKCVKDYCINSIVVCVAGFILYYISYKLVLVHLGISTNYLKEGYINWDFTSVMDALRILLGPVYRIMFPDPTTGYYSGEFVKTSVILFVCFVLFYVATKKKKNPFSVCIFSGCFLFAPFLLTMCFGAPAVGRTMLGLVLTVSFPWFLWLNTFDFSNVKKGIIKLFACYVLFLQILSFNQVVFGDHLSFQQDIRVGSTLAEELSTFEAIKSKPVVIVGSLNMENDLIIPLETLGASFFSWDYGNMLRMDYFFQYLGYQFMFTRDSDLIRKGAAYSDKMPTYPMDGSIVEYEEIIVIKLSEPADEWYQTNIF